MMILIIEYLYFKSTILKQTSVFFEISYKNLNVSKFISRIHVC